MDLRAFSLITALLLATSSLCQSVTEIAKKGIISTVSVIALDQINQPLSYGSGFIIDNELIVTNVHVIEGATSAYIIKNNEQKKHTVHGYLSIDKSNDIILLKVPGLTGTNVNISEKELPEIGERIYAIGNPKGLSGTFSEGIVSGIREIQNNKILQITAPISPGSSGGPLLDTKGDLIGVAFASYSEGQNLNFAIPSVYVKALLSKSNDLLAISNIKPVAKSTPQNDQKTITPNIKEGVTVRNIKMLDYKYIEFSIKNNLPYRVSDIKILFLVYDKTGTVVDYIESVYFKAGYGNKDGGIKPFLAKSVDFFSGAAEVNASSGSYVKARVLDFIIIEDN